MLTTTIRALLVVLFVIMLFFPSAWGYVSDRHGHRWGYWRSVLYIYTYGPSYEHLEFDGLRRLQTWLLLIVAVVASQIQSELIASLVTAIHHTLAR